MADEVRSLAQRSATASKETAQLIEESVRQIRGCGTIVSTTTQQFGAVKDNAGKVTTMVGEIATAARAQNEEVTSIRDVIANLTELTQQNAAKAEESAAAAEELSAQSEMMRSYSDLLKKVIDGHAPAPAPGLAGAAPAKQAAAVAPAGGPRKRAPELVEVG